MDTGFFKKGKYNWSDLESLISDSIEESLHLDYKSSKSLDKADSKKKEISKDVAAFANSDGGIIIYGIDEENHVPKGFSYVDGTVFTKEWLENVIDGNIQQKIHGIKIHVIRKDKDLKRSVYLIKIPVSTDAPHMSSDKKYYRRYNFKSVPMEEYEVRLLYRRDANSEIDFEAVWTRDLGREEDDRGIMVVRKEFSVHVRNISKVMEKNCKVEATLLNVDGLGVGFSYPRDANVNHRFSTENNHVLTAYNQSPIFSEEEHCIMKFDLTVAQHSYKKFRENAKLGMRLFDSVSIKETEYDLAELMKRPNEPENENDSQSSRRP